jgi:hypothetical protein
VRYTAKIEAGVRRRRVCLDCQRKFSTLEVPIEERERYGAEPLRLIRVTELDGVLEALRELTKTVERLRASVTREFLDEADHQPR